MVGWEPTDNESLLLDISGLGHLFGSETALVEAVGYDLRRLGLTSHAAVADTVGAAWAPAKYCKLQIADCRFQIAAGGREFPGPVW